MIEVKVSFHPDREQARQDTQYWGALALTPDEKSGIEDPIEMQRRADELPVERTESRWIVSDDPDEHAARVSEYLDMGFKHLVFHAPGPEQDEFIQRYGTEILPRLRSSR
jgi:coenzyme F420-dependent glucose-6-phosphate dehydrogenase